MTTAVTNPRSRAIDTTYCFSFDSSQGASDLPVGFCTTDVTVTLCIKTTVVGAPLFEDPVWTATEGVPVALGDVATGVVKAARDETAAAICGRPLAASPCYTTGDRVG